MTPTDRLAAVLAVGLRCGGCEKDEAIAKRIIAADPTLICPDPEAHAYERLLARVIERGWRLDITAGGWGTDMRVWNEQDEVFRAFRFETLAECVESMTAALEDKTDD